MNFLLNFKDIRTFIFDVDGVFTNSELIVLENGRLLRKMNVRDGFALKRAVEKGYNVCIITGGTSSGVEQRFKQLGVSDIHLGAFDKDAIFEEYLELKDIDPGEVLYMGDDMPDYKPMRKAAISACPKDASREIVELANYISPFNGGEGCVRDVIEKVLRLNGDWSDE